MGAVVTLQSKAPPQRTTSRRFCEECGSGTWQLESFDDNVSDHVLICANCGESLCFAGILEGDVDDVPPPTG